MTPVANIDFTKLHTYSLHDRPSKVTVAHFCKPLQPGMTVADLIAALPCQLAGLDFPEFVARLATCRRADRPLIVGMGAHVIKVGLAPILIGLMERGIITGLAMNGAGIVHDTEVALAGKTSEEVDAVLGSGSFGASRETGEAVNEAIGQGAAQGLGMGTAMGRWLVARNCPHNDKSLLASAHRLGIPVTVHVAIGTDIVHIHPQASGEAIGKTSYEDFRRFCGMVADLEGGAYVNIGSAVILPEVFLKALTAVRNLGYRVNYFTTANFDFIRHYRPLTNVVNRPTAEGGKGYSFVGHHELMIPLLAAALLNELVDWQGTRP